MYPLDSDHRKCRRCGKCLEACPALNLDRERAAREIDRLRAGKSGGPVLRVCHSCFVCNLACPNGLDVHGLILRSWARTRKGLEIPWRVRLNLPEQKRPNVWTRVAGKYDEEERILLAGAEGDVRGKEILYLGCNQLLDPYIASSPILKELTVAASPGVCCGEPYYRMGFIDAFERMAARWLDHWSGRAPARMVAFCTPCLNMLKNVYPARIGRRPPFELVGLLDWIEEKVDRGEIELNHPVRITLMVQDSCHSRMLGGEYMERARRLMRAAGVELIEERPPPMGSGCCGFAAAAPTFSPLPMLRMGTQRLRQAGRMGAGGIAAYCNGCVLMLSMAGVFHPSPPPVYHLMDLIDMAAGNPRATDHRVRARVIIVAALKHAAAKALTPGKNSLDLDAGLK